MGRIPLRSQARRRQSVRFPLLHGGHGAKTRRLKIGDERFRRTVVSDGNRQVKIAGEARFGSNGDGQSADQCPWLIPLPQQGGNSTQEVSE